MPSFSEGTVSEIINERRGLQRVLVRIDEGSGLSESHMPADQPAYVLTDLIGKVALDDRVIMNTTAVDLGLGTGGWHIVHWNLSRRGLELQGEGQIMKLRYTSLQINTGAAEEVSETEPVSLHGMPVVTCLLHSQMAVVAAVLKELAPSTRIAYVMTDQACLPLALSDLVHELTERQLLAGTVTTGQSFGGDIEAVNIASGLEVARKYFNADVIIVAPGPGVVGTGTRLGFGGLEAVHVLDDTERAGAVPIFCLRWSDADRRDRHRGLSHHSSTVMERTHARVHVGAPSSTDKEALEKAIGADAEIEFFDIPNVGATLDSLDLPVTTMGRHIDRDPGFFSFSAAAGILAAKFNERR